MAKLAPLTTHARSVANGVAEHTASEQGGLSDRQAARTKSAPSTQSTTLESRDQFVTRLREAVKWVNKHKAKELWDLSTNQKKRAADCLASQPPGGRTKW